MNPRVNSRLALFLAGVLPFMPMLRLVVPVLRTAENPSAAWIFKWVIGAAIVGYDAVSSASSVAISPPSATIGVAYAGTITYSGSHAGAVVSMGINGNCLGTYTIAPGLTATYSGGNTARVTGTPTSGVGTVGLSVKVYDGFNCTGGLTDTRTTSLIIQNSGGGPVAPSMVVVPQNTVAQVGADVILSGGASGNPTPSYYWKQGPVTIPNATNNTLLIPAVQLTNAGVYSLFASNSQGQANSACDLSVAVTPGSDNLALLYTNYSVAQTAVTMYSFITNVLLSSNSYSWSYDLSPIGFTNLNLSLTAGQTTPAKSGVYSVTFNSVVGASTIVNNQEYDSYWAFGYLPVVSSPPAGQSVSAGTNVTFFLTLAGGSYPNVFLYRNQTNLVWQTNLPSYNPSTSGATTNFSTTISNVTPASSGAYTYVITNFWGSVTSAPANLTVSLPFSIPTPAGRTNYAGNNITLNAAPTGTGPFFFLWQKGGGYLSDGGTISGSGTSNLLISPAAPGNAGNYQVVVTNNSGSLTSGVAVVSVLPVPLLNAVSGAAGVNLTAAGGLTGSNYVVEVSSNLVAGAWTPRLTNVVPPGGAISFTDTNFGGPGMFYRLMFP